MAALFLLLAIVGGIVVGDLVLENAAADDITILNHPISGVSEGVLLAMAAALGVVVGLLVVASASTTRTRRVRRKQLRAAGHDLNRQMAELQRENAKLREELASRDQRLRHRGEVASPDHLGSTSWVGATATHGVTVVSQPAQRHPEPLYEEAKRAARLRSHPDLAVPFVGDRARHWQTDEYGRGA